MFEIKLLILIKYILIDATDKKEHDRVRTKSVGEKICT